MTGLPPRGTVWIESIEPIESEWSQLQEFSVSRVTLTDVAQHTGVSIATAHRALQDKPGVAAKKAHAIRRAAREMGYPFGRRGGNSASRSQTLSVGLRPCENFRDGTFSDDPRMVSIISAFQQSSQELGLNACVEVTKLSRETLANPMAFGRHDGLLLLGHHTAEQGRLLQDAGMPFVSLLDSVQGIEHSRVVDDYASAISQSVQYLLLFQPAVVKLQLLLPFQLLMLLQQQELLIWRCQQSWLQRMMSFQNLLAYL